MQDTHGPVDKKASRKRECTLPASQGYMRPRCGAQEIQASPKPRAAFGAGIHLWILGDLIKRKDSDGDGIRKRAIHKFIRYAHGASQREVGIYRGKEVIGASVLNNKIGSDM